MYDGKVIAVFDTPSVVFFMMWEYEEQQAGMSCHYAQWVSEN